MRVTKVVDARPGRPAVELVDDTGVPVADVAGFLRLLTVRDYSPNTVRAYAHDLQKLYRFLHERGLTVEGFRPALAVSFIEWLRTRSSAGRKAQRLDLALTAGNGRLLAAKTCNRVLAAVSSFFEYLISVERYGGADNPIVTIPDQAAARVPGRPRAPLVTSRPQRPVRRALRIKTVESLPRPMSDDTYVALLGVLRTRRDRALLEMMWEGGLRPGEVLGLRLEDISYGRRRIVVRHRTDHPSPVSALEATSERDPRMTMEIRQDGPLLLIEQERFDARFPADPADDLEQLQHQDFYVTVKGRGRSGSARLTLWR